MHPVRRAITWAGSMAAALLWNAKAVSCQESSLHTAVATKATHLARALGKREGAVQVPTGTRLVLMTTERHREWVYGSLTDGREGWLRYADVRVQRWAANDSATVARRAPAAEHACANSIESCPKQGCTAEPTRPIDPHLNELKNADPPQGSPEHIAWRDIRELQRYVDQTLHFKTGFAVVFSEDQRTALRAIPTSDGTFGEGSLVSLDGYITKSVGTKANPHLGGAESCNCDLKHTVDWHINLGPTPHSNEYQGIVIEVTPRDTLSGWSLDSLASIKAKGKKLRVVGQLLFDNRHKVRRSSEENKRGNPPRFSLWEVHPITAIYVCGAHGNCSH